jgi:hypothetical protein
MGDYDRRTTHWAELCREFDDRKTELLQLLRAADAPFAAVADQCIWRSPIIDAIDPVDAAEARLKDVQERMRAFIETQYQTRH